MLENETERTINIFSLRASRLQTQLVCVTI